MLLLSSPAFTTESTLAMVSSTQPTLQSASTCDLNASVEDQVSNVGLSDQLSLQAYPNKSIPKEAYLNGI